MESSRTCPWPPGSLRTHFQVLGLGLVKFSMTHRCIDTAAKKVLMILAKTVKCQFVPILPRCNNASDAFLSQAWCARTSSLTWRPSIKKGRHGTDFWVYAVCPWPWPWPCHLCPWLHHWHVLFFVATRKSTGGMSLWSGKFVNFDTKIIPILVPKWPLSFVNWSIDLATEVSTIGLLRDSSFIRDVSSSVASSTSTSTIPTINGISITP